MNDNKSPGLKRYARPATAVAAFFLPWLLLVLPLQYASALFAGLFFALMAWWAPGWRDD